MNRFVMSLIAFGMAVLVSSTARGQYPQTYALPRSPYAYPGPAGPVRQTPQTFVGSSYGFTPPGGPNYCVPAGSTYPVYSSFYDPNLTPRYSQPGPYWYTRNYPFTNGYYSYYYSPGYFRY